MALNLEPATRWASRPSISRAARARASTGAHPMARWLVLVLFALVVTTAPISHLGAGSLPSHGARDVSQVEPNAVVPIASAARAMPSLLASNNRLAKSFPWLLVAFLVTIAALAARTNRRARERDRVRGPSLVSHLLPLRRGPPLTLAS